MLRANADDLLYAGARRILFQTFETIKNEIIEQTENVSPKKEKKNDN